MRDNFMENNDNKKGKKNKGSKKKKYLFRKLGIESTFLKARQTGSGIINTIDELIKQPPSIVIGRGIRDCRLNVGGGLIELRKDVEVVMPVGLFVQGYNSKKTHEKFLKPSSRTFSERFRRYRGQDLTDKKLLIWRFGGAGDIVFSQPLLQYIKHKWPTSKISYATAPDNVEIFSFFPKGLVDRPLTMPFTAKQLDEHDYHLTFEGGIERCKEAHVLNSIDVFRKIANLDFDPNLFQTKITPNPDLVLQLRRKLPPKLIALQVRASSPLRTFQLNKGVEIINALTELGFNVGILDSHQMTNDVEAFVSQVQLFRHPFRVFNLAQYSLNFQHCIAILQNCEGAVATDSSITHFGCALGKPVVGVYGPFMGELRMKYYRTGAWVNTCDTWNHCGKCPCCFHEAEIPQCPYMVRNLGPGCMEFFSTQKVIEKFVDLYEKLVEKKGESN